MTAEFLLWLGGITAFLTAAAAFVKQVVRPLMKRAATTWREVQEFLQDWRGEDARPGRDRIPGMPERVANIERHVGNGHPIPLRDRVESQASTLNRVVQYVGLSEE